jgi:uncharacterized protein YnzC (UPF0291/DUF896 family)
VVISSEFLYRKLLKVPKTQQELFRQRFLIAMYKQNLKNHLRHKKALDDESLAEIDPHMLRQL